jgi:formate/nitrite transporter FocA (FNT family)
MSGQPTEPALTKTKQPRENSAVTLFKDQIRDITYALTSTVPIQPDVKRSVTEAISVLAHRGKHLAQIPLWRVAVQCFGGGVFLCIGAFLGISLSVGIEAQGLANALLSFGLVTGFMFTIATGSHLFTEANIIIPISLFKWPKKWHRLIAAWISAYVGNIIGAIFMGTLFNIAMCTVNPGIIARMAAIAKAKLLYANYGTPFSWWAAFFGGVIGNLILCGGASLGSQGKWNTEKFLGVFFGVFCFIVVYSQNSIANVCLFSVELLYQNIYNQDLGVGLTWEKAIVWNIIPCSLGNIFGASMFGFVWLIVDTEIPKRPKVMITDIPPERPVEMKLGTEIEMVTIEKSPLEVYKEVNQVDKDEMLQVEKQSEIKEKREEKDMVVPTLVEKTIDQPIPDVVIDDRANGNIELVDNPISEIDCEIDKKEQGLNQE